MAVCRSSISAKQAEADAAGRAVAESASREQAAAKAVEDAGRRMAELQAELEQLKQDERREHLRIQVRRSSHNSACHFLRTMADPVAPAVYHGPDYTCASSFESCLGAAAYWRTVWLGVCLLSVLAGAE